MHTREYVPSHLESTRFSEVRHKDVLGLFSKIWQQPAKQRCGHKRSGKLHCDKSWNVLKADTSESIGERARERNGGIGKERGCSEPISGSDVCGDGKRDHVGAGFRASPNDRHQSEGCHKLTE